MRNKKPNRNRKKDNDYEKKSLYKIKTRHHMFNKCNGGKDEPENLLTLNFGKHKFLHYIFGNLDLFDIIILLIRIAHIKHYEKINPKIKELYKHL